MKDRESHLNEDDIIRAVIDQRDLTEEIKGHLLKCPLCQKKKLIIEQELKYLGRMAREFTPLPEKNRVDIFDHPVNKSFPYRLWRYAFVTGFVAVLLIAGIWLYSPVKKIQEYRTGKLIKEMQEDQVFIEDIQRIEEQAFYGFYSDADKDFLEYILPVKEGRDS
jgi:hypothetical protein